MRESLKVLVESHANGLGLSVGAAIEDALLQALGLDREPRTELLIRINRWLLGVSSPQAFPQDIVLLTFLQIAEDLALLELYERASADADPAARRSNRASLNRQIGRMIRHVLRAVPGDRRKDDPRLKDALIGSYVRLHPEGSSTSLEAIVKVPESEI